MRKKLKSRVYFIESTNGLIKIGKSKNPIRRLKELQTASPISLKIIKTIRGGIFLETILHRYFDKCRKHGEWFDPDKRMIDYLNGGTIAIDELINKVSRHRRYLKNMKRKFI